MMESVAWECGVFFQISKAVVWHSPHFSEPTNSRDVGWERGLRPSPTYDTVLSWSWYFPNSSVMRGESGNWELRAIR